MLQQFDDYFSAQCNTNPRQ